MERSLGETDKVYNLLITDLTEKERAEKIRDSVKARQLLVHHGFQQFHMQGGAREQMKREQAAGGPVAYCYQKGTPGVGYALVIVKGMSATSIVAGETDMELPENSTAGTDTSQGWALDIVRKVLGLEEDDDI